MVDAKTITVAQGEPHLQRHSTAFVRLTVAAWLVDRTMWPASSTVTKVSGSATCDVPAFSPSTCQSSRGAAFQSAARSQSRASTHHRLPTSLQMKSCRCRVNENAALRTAHLVGAACG